jgi:hypothetical protein
MKLDYDKNMAKKESCISKGYKFEFWIFNSKGVKLVV